VTTWACLTVYNIYVLYKLNSKPTRLQVWLFPWWEFLFIKKKHFAKHFHFKSKIVLVQQRWSKQTFHAMKSKLTVNAMWNKLTVNAMWNKLTVNAMWNKLKWNEMNKLTILQTHYPACSTLKLSVLQPDNPNPLHWEDTHIHQLLLCRAPLRLWALGSSPAHRIYAMWINLTTHAINNVNQINSQCFVNQADSTKTFCKMFFFNKQKFPSWKQQNL
jgi:hypothetical protein